MKDYQHKLFPYAYNILGSAEDARDAVQDVMVKYMSVPHEGLENESAYLIRSVINRAINLKKSKRYTAVDYRWLPEPFATEKADADVNRNEIISYSMLVLLESLNPKERAAFILKEAFDYSHEEIAVALDIGTENSRKLLSRAKTKLEEHKNRPVDSYVGASEYMEGYVSVIKSGDVKALEKMLSDDIALTVDGGGKVNVVTQFMQGNTPVSELLLYIYRTYLSTCEMRMISVNGQPALSASKNGKMISCQVFDFDAETGRIRNIYSLVDPGKLKNIPKI